MGDELGWNNPLIRSPLILTSVPGHPSGNTEVINVLENQNVTQQLLAPPVRVILAPRDRGDETKRRKNDGCVLLKKGSLGSVKFKTINWVVATPIIFYVHPDPWGNDPIWRAYFSNGVENNYQLANILYGQISKEIGEVSSPFLPIWGTISQFWKVVAWPNFFKELPLSDPHAQEIRRCVFFLRLATNKHPPVGRRWTENNSLISLFLWFRKIFGKDC